MKIIAIISVSALAFVAIAATPTTQPGSNDARYLQGWVDAGGIVAVHPPTVVQIVDLGPIIARQTAPLVLPKLVLPNHYTLSAEATVKFSIDGQGSNLTCNQAITDFLVTGKNLSFGGFVVDRAGVFAIDAGDKNTFHDLSVGEGQPAGSVVQAFKTGPGGTNATLLHFHCGTTTTVSYYIDQGGASLTDVTGTGSVNEYVFRATMPATGITQSGLLLSGCSFANGTRKDCFGVRQFHNVHITGCTFTGDGRWGQVPGAGFPATTSVGQYCNNCELDHCTFASNGMVISLVEAYQGVSLYAHDNVLINPLAPPFSADVMTTIKTANNTVQIYAGAKAWEFWAVSSKGKNVPMGGDKTITIPAPK